MKPTTSIDYKQAGVDIDAADALVQRLKPLAKRTQRAGVLGGLGGFGALFEMPKGYHEPVLVSGTDGVGTKLRLAIDWHMHDTVGIDLVAMSVNDILVQGAEPLFFLDYFACGRLDVEVATRVIAGIAQGCEQSGCALIGGETAEMPGMYPPGEYDLAGFAVGVVESKRCSPATRCNPTTWCLGWPLVGCTPTAFAGAGVFGARRADCPTHLDGMPLRERLMAPTRIYVKAVRALLQQHPVHAMAHITGGGLLENIPRVLPPGLGVRLHRHAWPTSELFAWLQATAGINDQDMNRTFNNGIGMVLIVPPNAAQAAADLLQQAGETVYTLGHVQAIAPNAAAVEVC